MKTTAKIQPHAMMFYDMSIAFCTASAVRSIEIVDRVLAHVEGATQNDRESLLEDIDQNEALSEIQNVILQGAAVSRYFWPTDAPHRARGNELRSRYKVGDNSSLKSRALRNAIEHFDERLDNYFAQMIVGVIIPHYFGWDDERDGVPHHFFRAYFIESGQFEILGERFDIHPIAAELRSMNEIAKGYVRRT
jgi:hypothetical protein